MPTVARILSALAGVAVLALIGTDRVAADEFAERRATCEPVMTVVNQDCTAAIHFICPDGGRYSERADEDGTITADLNDADLNILYSTDVVSGEGIQRIISIERPFSFAELLRDGSSSASYTAQLLLIFPEPRSARVTLDAKLLGRSRTLGGVEFQVALLTMGFGIGTGGIMATIAGEGLIDVNRRLLLTDGGSLTFNGAVIEDFVARISEVILPGEPGFMSLTPASCTAQLSSIVPLRGSSHG